MDMDMDMDMVHGHGHVNVHEALLEARAHDTVASSRHDSHNLQIASSCGIIISTLIAPAPPLYCDEREAANDERPPPSTLCDVSDGIHSAVFNSRTASA